MTTKRPSRLDYCQYLLVSQINYTITNYADHTGLVNCVYVNPETGQYWVIDYRVYDPQCDGKTKLDHMQDMLTHIVHHKQLPFHAVLMDTWYATKDLMMFIASLKKVYYCPLKSNRQVDDSPYRYCTTNSKNCLSD